MNPTHGYATYKAVSRVLCEYSDCFCRCCVMATQGISDELGKLHGTVLERARTLQSRLEGFAQSIVASKSLHGARCHNLTTELRNGVSNTIRL